MGNTASNISLPCKKQIICIATPAKEGGKGAKQKHGRMEDTAGVELAEMTAVNVERAQSLNQSQVTEDEYTPQHYHRLARIMARENNLAIFRRFDEINLLQLMSLQAEIVELKSLFETGCQQDDEAGLMYSKSFHELRRSQPRNDRVESDEDTGSTVHSQETITDGSANPPSNLQRNLLRDLGDRMKKYSM